jgi:hypothetical protein
MTVFHRFWRMLPATALAVVVGCGDEAMIPADVLNSPPAARTAPRSIDDYYPEQPAPSDKVADNQPPPVQLTVDRPSNSCPFAGKPRPRRAARRRAATRFA